MSNSLVFTEELISLNHNLKNSFIHPSKKGVLTTERLTWFENEVQQILELKDVVGASIVPSNHQYQLASFVIHAYPLVQLNWLSPRRRRVLKNYTFACTNLQRRSRWLTAIYYILRGIPLDSSQIISPRHLHVILNPKSGRQKARRIFQQVCSVWENSNIQISLTETTSRGFAQEIIQAIPLDKIDGLVVIGGDGTLYEVINGLMSRSDWKKAILTPIGVIPAGTSNGLCKSILDISGEPYDPINAAFVIAKGKIRPLDLIEVEQRNRRYYSFLSLSWAFVSEVDIGSDKLRFLGSLKNDIYALIRILMLRSYRGKLFLLNPSKPSCAPTVIEDKFIVFWAMNVIWASYNIKATPYAHLSDGTMDILIVRKGISRWQLLVAFLRSSNGKHVDLPYVEYYKVRSFRLEPLTKLGFLAVDGELVDYTPIQMEVLRGIARVFCR